MEDKKISERLNEIFVNRKGINLINECLLKDEKVFDFKIDMLPRELLLIFYDVEEQFCVKIPEKEIVSGRFDTFNHILEIVQKYL